ncbi:MAG: serine hydrolase [Gemmatimonadota bacterium]|nr:MAG: serine hydrolase [Gemmatimonadota bacterium]
MKRIHLPRRHRATPVAGIALSLVALLAASFGNAAAGTGLASVQDLRPAIDEIARPYVEPSGWLFGRKPKLVGMVVGIVRDGERAVFGYGTTDHESGQPPNEDTVFEIGSISKTFTGVLLAEAVRRGEVRLEDPAAGYLPADVAKKAAREPAITLLDLATHTSGLPRVPANLDPKDLDDPFADFDERALWKFVAKRGLKRRDEAKYEYSNLGMGMLGYLLARSTPGGPKGWDALVTERVLLPLGMSDTGVEWSADQEARRATPYHKWGKRDRIWSFAALQGAGALHSTAADMLTWAEVNLGHGAGDLAEAVRASHEPHFRMADRLQSGLAWVVAEPEEIGETVIWHNGGTGGYSSHLALLPGSDLGVVVLANTSSELVDRAAQEIVKEILRIGKETS